MANEHNDGSPVRNDSTEAASDPATSDSTTSAADPRRALTAEKRASSAGPAKPRSPWKLQLGLLSGMLLLALIGMGLNEALWEYWLIVVLAYGGVGAWRSTAQAKKAERPYLRALIRQAAHWGVLLAFMAILVWLERSSGSETITREVAAKASLVLLALTCCLAGVHFEWLFLVVGSVLTIMVVALETVEHGTRLWAIMIVAAVIGVGLFYWRTRSAPANGGDAGA